MRHSYLMGNTFQLILKTGDFSKVVSLAARLHWWALVLLVRALCVSVRLVRPNCRGGFWDVVVGDFHMVTVWWCEVTILSTWWFLGPSDSRISSSPYSLQSVHDTYRTGVKCVSCGMVSRVMATRRIVLWSSGHAVISCCVWGWCRGAMSTEGLPSAAIYCFC